MKFVELSEQPCSISRSLAVLGDRWTLVVLKQAFAGTRRFDEFQRTLGISRSRLADRLERLVDQGLLERREYFDRRTRHEYRLTEKGRAVYPVLMALRTWGDTYAAPDGPPLEYRHKGCSGQVEVSLTCDDCQQPLGPRDVEVALGPGFPSS
jgi:DNA-binding HxlR family transcriptional regulator